MRNKFLSVLAIMFVVLISITNVYATDGMFHLGVYEDIYKLSEQEDVIDLPFVNMFANAATYDKIITHSGISFGQSTIDVDDKLEGAHILFTNDMITIKGEVENALIFGSNAVIEGKITEDSIILAPTVQILENATIEKDVIIVANNLDIKGTIKGNVIATVAETANISGVIQDDLRMIAREVVFDGEEIKGDLYLETNADTTAIKEKYTEATIVSLVEETESAIDWMNVFTNGVITVIVYSIICFVVTRKNGNIVEKACNKFKKYTTYGLLMSIVMLILLILLPMLLIVLAVAGFGIIAWPILIAFIAIVLLTWTTAMLIVGMAIFDAIKDKVGKFKIPVIALIYIVLFALTQITFISTYANMAMLIIALAIIMTMITKKLPSEVKEKVSK